MRIVDRLVPGLLRDVPDFRHLWTGQTISVFGDEINRIAIPLVAVLILGADAAEMGSLTAASLGVLWLLGSHLLRLRDLPDVAVLETGATGAPD